MATVGVKGLRKHSREVGVAGIQKGGDMGTVYSLHMGLLRPKATYIPIGLDLQWGPGRCPGKGV